MGAHVGGRWSARNVLQSRASIAGPGTFREFSSARTMEFCSMKLCSCGTGLRTVWMYATIERGQAKCAVRVGGAAARGFDAGGISWLLWPAQLQSCICRPAGEEPRPS
jgi:hypothetical protein